MQWKQSTLGIRHNNYVKTTSTHGPMWYKQMESQNGCGLAMRKNAKTNRTDQEWNRVTLIQLSKYRSSDPTNRGIQNSGWTGWSETTQAVMFSVKLGPHNAWYVFVVRHVWMCQKDSSNLIHTVCCVNLPPNWQTRCDEWTNDTST